MTVAMKSSPNETFDLILTTYPEIVPILQTLQNEIDAALPFAGPWLTDTPDIYYNAGNVGVGTDEPAFPLTIEKAGPILLSLVSTGGNQLMIEKGAATNYAVTTYKLTGGPEWTVGYRTTAAAGADTYSIFSTTLGANALTILNDGKVGMGTIIPAARLHSLATTEQLRLGYDAGNHVTFTVGATGDITIVPSGGDLILTGNQTISGLTASRVVCTDSSKKLVSKAIPIDYYIGNYADLSAAVTAIGASLATLVLDSVQVTNSLTTPATMTIRCINGGGIQPNTGQTVTILGPIEAGPTKIFYNALASQGTISFGTSPTNNLIQKLPVNWWGAVGDNSTDNTAAIVATIVAGAKQRTIKFSHGKYLCSSAISSLVSSIGLTLEGAAPCKADRLMDSASELIYTGTAAIFLDVKSSFGLTIKNLSIRVSNASFTGDVISTDDGGVTFGLTVQDCLIGGLDTTGDNARSGLELGGVVEAKIHNCGFYFSDYGILGTRASGTNFSNGVHISRCRFVLLNDYGIGNPYQSWTIDGQCTFEPVQFNTGTNTGVAAGIICGVLGGLNAQSVTISNNNFYDASNVGGIWIDWIGNNLVVEGNYFALGSTATGVRLTGSGFGFRVGGNYVSGSSGATWITNQNAAWNQVADDGTNVLEANIVKYAFPTFLIPADGRFGIAEVQTKVIGSIDANGDLTLEGTSHATKTTSSVFIQPNGGNVVVGGNVTVPSLDVSGAVDPVIRITDTTTPVTFYFGANNTLGYIGTQTNHPYTFLTNDTIRMRLETTGNLKLAGSAVRGTTEGTNHLDIFGGTAPVGTLTDGASLYVTTGTGELRVLDAGGTSTLLSQHASDAPEWMYDDEDMPPNISCETNIFAGRVRFTNRTRQAKLNSLAYEGQPLPPDLQHRQIIYDESFDEYNQRLDLAPGDPRFLTIASWDDDQQSQLEQRAIEREEWLQQEQLHLIETEDFEQERDAHSDLVVARDLEIEEWDQSSPENKASTQRPESLELFTRQAPKPLAPQPPVYIALPRPSWLKN